MITVEEQKMATVVASKLRRWTKKSPIVSDEFISRFNMGRKRYQLSGPRFRVICNYLRSEAYVPIVSTRCGYSVVESPEVLLKQHKSLQARADKIIEAANGMKRMANRIKRQKNA